MEMTRFEKFFVNRELKGRRNASRIRDAANFIGADAIRDVLEIGCGIGTASAFVADAFGWNVIGTDFDPAQIDAAKDRYPEGGGLRFQREDATRLSFPDNAFDFAFAQTVFHHIPEWPKAVAELARVIRPGGTLLWMDLVIPARLRGVLAPFIRLTGVCVREDIRHALEENGFRLQRERRATPTGITFDELILTIEKGTQS